MAAALSITACGGSGSANTVSSADAAAEYQADSTVKKILWTYAGDLEARKGSDKNIGTAGLLSGVSGGYVIAGGGANFPQGGPETGGPRVYYLDIYVMKPEDGSLTLVTHTTMGYEIGYGASITAPEGIYYIGGSPVDGKGDKITLVKADEKGEVTFDEIVGAGKQDGKASNRFYAFALDTKETVELAPVPGEETRTQCVSQVLDGRIYVFSGGDAVALLIFNALENAWSAVGEVPFDAPCGEGLVLNGDYIYSINGEIKPGTRTCRMYGGLLVR